jgi:hypothetical protein
MRVGNEAQFPLTAEIGLHMVSQFGGTRYRDGVYAQNPSRIRDFFTALIPLAGDASYDACDQASVAGNMLGAWQGAITWNDEKWKLRTYYEHTFEDQSQMFWEYGLWTEQLVGLELELKQFKWMKNFVRRFFVQQFKRSCLPDGPKVGTVGLSPRGDFRMPSDAVSALWMEEIAELSERI